MLKDGQKMTSQSWDALSGEAQAWYNDSVKLYQAHTNPNDIKEFSDHVPTTARATLNVAPAAPVEEDEAPVEAEEAPAPVEEEAPVEAEDEPLEAAEAEPEEAEVEDAPVDAEEVAFEEDEPPVEVEEPVVAAAPKPSQKPAVKTPSKAPVRKPPPAVKTPSKAPVKSIKAKDDGEVTRPPKPAAPGASTTIKRMMIRNPDVTNAELMEKLKEKHIDVTPISVSTIRSDFKHSIKVLQEAGFCQEMPAP
jgi:hypothetical protein